MNAMNYRGYTAKIEFDERDNIFVGRLLAIRTMISFHGETVAELRAAFETAVDEFLADCKDQGVKPEKTCIGKIDAESLTRNSWRSAGGGTSCGQELESMGG